MTTASDLITSALRTAGIITMEETPAAYMLNRGLESMNNMLDSWSNDSMNVYARAWETFTLTNSLGGPDNPYTIGAGGDFNTARPINIRACYSILGGVTYPMDVISDEVYAESITVKSLPGIPRLLNLDNAYPIGNIRLYPVPSTSYQLFILSEKLLGDYTLNETFDLPPGWARAIIFNLADELCGAYGQETPDSVMRVAVKSLALIRKSVMRMRSLDAQPRGNNANSIYSGYWQ